MCGLHRAFMWQQTSLLELDLLHVEVRQQSPYIIGCHLLWYGIQPDATPLFGRSHSPHKGFNRVCAYV